MKHAVVAIALALVWGQAMAQAQSNATKEMLDVGSQKVLGQLRPGLLQRVADDMGIDTDLTLHVLGAGEEELLRATLRDRSRLPLDKFDTAVRARVSLLQVSRLASEDQNFATALKAYGLQTTQIRDDALHAVDPVTSMELLGQRIGRTRAGALILRRDEVLITKPEAVADDNLQPGQMAPGMLPGGGVWRTGLKFAALIAIRRGTVYEAHCSGTFIGKRWIVTAAHCLLDPEGNNGKIDLTTLAVFLPFQGGSETVTSPTGAVNHKMRRVRVLSAPWIGDDMGVSFPKSERSFSDLILQGKDLALLELDTADLSTLTSPIAVVNLFSELPAAAPVSFIGYGLTDKPASGDLTLLVGVRKTLPDGLDKGKALLAYGANKEGSEGGTCGGDSGGGLFAGRMDGTFSQPRLIGVISALTGSTPIDGVGICLAEQQNYTSLVFPANRAFICKYVPSVCAS